MKSQLIGLLAPSLLLFPTGCLAGLLAHYPFDSDFSDAVGGNDLSAANGTPDITTAGGESAFGGGALNLVNADQEWLTLDSAIQFGASDPWSISFWARRTGDATEGMVMGNNSARNSFIWLTDNFSGFRFRPESSSSASNDFTTPKDSGYHHYVLVADGTGRLSLYVDNGPPEVKSSAAGGTSFTINTIGDAYDGNTSLAFDGQLDEVRIYDEAIDAAKVGELFSGAPDTDPPGLVSITTGTTGPMGTASTVVYTVSFSRDMDETTVGADDFGNAGTASVTIGAPVEVSPGVFTIEVTPNSAGSLQLGLLQGASLADAAGNALDMSNAIVSDMVITVEEGFGPAGVRRLRVVLVGGQSNADGRAAPSELPTRPVNLQQPQDDVDFIYRVESVIHPLTTLRPGRSETNGFGPAITCGRRLADELADRITTRVAVIKYANGGTNLHTQWAAGGDATTRGDGSQYLRFQETVTAGVAALSSTYPNAVIEWVGMVWLQGESDAGSASNAAAYEANLTRFIADVRLTYGADLRFVVIRLSSGQTAINAANLATIRAAQTAVAAAHPLTALVDSDGFGMKTDRLHFDGLGQQQNGEASAVQLLNLHPFLSPPRIVPQPDGDFDLTVDDAFEGFVYRLGSSDTMAPGDWDPVEEKTATGDRVEFTVTPDPGQDRRFFRVERTLP